MFIPMTQGGAAPGARPLQPSRLDLATGASVNAEDGR